ncbi:MAG: hypothetical protein ACYCZ0_02795 [Minisyncoccota bacterium]
MTDRLTDAARQRIEQFANEHGTEVPPIPHLDFGSEALSDDVRARIEDHTTKYGAPART